MSNSMLYKFYQGWPNVSDGYALLIILPKWGAFFRADELGGARRARGKFRFNQEAPRRRIPTAQQTRMGKFGRFPHVSEAPYDFPGRRVAFGRSERNWQMKISHVVGALG